MQYPTQSKTQAMERNQVSKPFYFIAFVLMLLSTDVMFAQTTQTFTSSSSFTAAAGVPSLSVECWGGGGGGGNAGHTGSGTSRGGGGAGGAYAKKTISSPSGAYTVTVGTGGAGGTTGGDSWFGCTCTVMAKGGAAGGNGSKSNGAGANGTTTGSAGDLIYQGGHGATATVLGTGAGGGGAGSTGPGGNSSLTIVNGTGTANYGGDGAAGFLLGLAVADGHDGNNYGGGGCGATCITLGIGSSATGGKGGDGLLTVTYTCPVYNVTNTANTTTCAGNAATVTLTSAAANLPAGTYTVTYNLSSPNAATGNTATMTVSTAGTGTFTTSALANSGITGITITNLKSGSGVGCSNIISANNTANITVYTAPGITGQPTTPAATCSGSGTQTISVSATGSNLVYSWRKNGSPVSNGGVYSGQGTATLTLTNATAAEAGTYDVVVSGSCSPSVTSNTVTVTVRALTIISSDATPVTQVKLLNATPANIALTAAGASIGYQWYSNTSNSNYGGTSVGSAHGGQTNTYTPSTASESTIYYYCVVSGTCGTEVSSAVRVIATNTATWLGGGTANWSTNSNWNTGLAPSGTNHALLPTGNTPYPQLSASCAITNIDLQSASSITIGSNTLTINGTISGTGIFTGSAASGLVINGNAGTIYFTQSGTGNCLKYFTINTGGSASLGNELNISAGSTTNDEGVVAINGTGVLTTGGLLTIKSNQYSTARIAQGSAAGGYISGDVTIERYIPQNSNKAWRMLAANTSGQTIKEAWQENQAPMVNGNPGYGIMITKKFNTMAEANAAGFDTISASPSIYAFSSAVNTWVALTNTNSKLFASEEGYFVFIRGDRQPGQFSAFTAPVAPTVLRSKGTIYQGDQPVKIAIANKYTLLRNPFASAIDLRNVAIGGGLVNAFQVWDPKLTGSTGNGAYQTLTKVGADYVVTPGGGSYGASGSVVNTVESGAAFIVQATGTDGTVQVAESSKTGGSNPVFRPLSLPFTGKRLMANLYADNGNYTLVDGNMILFDNENDNAIDKNDVRKLINIGETFGVDKTGTPLVVERRTVPAAADTVLFTLRNLKKINYQAEFIADNMEMPGMYGYIEDRYTNTGMFLNATGSTLFNFSVTTDAASFAADRLRLVFKPAAVLPVTFTSVKAVQKASDVLVEWKVENGMNTTRYEIERSVDGNIFKTIGTVDQSNATMYNWIDQAAAKGIFYYRIKSADNNGRFQYSKSVKVSTDQSSSAMNVSPNPVKNSIINIQLAEQKAGRFQLALFNLYGQQLYKKSILHSGGDFNRQIKIASNIAAGLYELQVILPDGTIQSRKLVIQPNE